MVLKSNSALGEQGMGTRGLHQRLQSRYFRDQDALACRRKAVVTPSSIIQVVVGPLVRFLDQAVRRHSRHGAIEGARTQPHPSASPARDFPLDGISMTFSVHQGQE